METAYPSYRTKASADGSRTVWHAPLGRRLGRERSGGDGGDDLRGAARGPCVTGISLDGWMLSAYTRDGSGGPRCDSATRHHASRDAALDGEKAALASRARGGPGRIGLSHARMQQLQIS
jgi:hypothetical protein